MPYLQRQPNGLAWLETLPSVEFACVRGLL